MRVKRASMRQVHVAREVEGIGVVDGIGVVERRELGGEEDGSEVVKTC